MLSRFRIVDLNNAQIRNCNKAELCIQTSTEETLECMATFEYNSSSGIWDVPFRSILQRTFMCQSISKKIPRIVDHKLLPVELESNIKSCFLQDIVEHEPQKLAQESPNQLLCFNIARGPSKRRGRFETSVKVIDFVFHVQGSNLCSARGALHGIVFTIFCLQHSVWFFVCF